MRPGSDKNDELGTQVLEGERFNFPNSAQYQSIPVNKKVSILPQQALDTLMPFNKLFWTFLKENFFENPFVKLLRSCI